MYQALYQALETPKGKIPPFDPSAFNKKKKKPGKRHTGEMLPIAASGGYAIVTYINEEPSA